MKNPKIIFLAHFRGSSPLKCLLVGGILKSGKDQRNPGIPRYPYDIRMFDIWPRRLPEKAKKMKFLTVFMFFFALKWMYKYNLAFYFFQQLTIKYIGSQLALFPGPPPPPDFYIEIWIIFYVYRWNYLKLLQLFNKKNYHCWIWKLYTFRKSFIAWIFSFFERFMIKNIYK